MHLRGREVRKLRGAFGGFEDRREIAGQIQTLHFMNEMHVPDHRHLATIQAF